MVVRLLHLYTKEVVDVHVEDVIPFVGGVEVGVTVAALDTNEYVVEFINAHRFVNGKLQLLVKMAWL